MIMISQSEKKLCSMDNGYSLTCAERTCLGAFMSSHVFNTGDFRYDTRAALPHASYIVVDMPEGMAEDSREHISEDKVRTAPVACKSLFGKVEDMACTAGDKDNMVRTEGKVGRAVGSWGRQVFVAGSLTKNGEVEPNHRNRTFWCLIIYTFY